MAEKHTLRMRAPRHRWTNDECTRCGLRRVRVVAGGVQQSRVMTYAMRDPDGSGGWSTTNPNGVPPCTARRQ
jgi:hypothetical protein